MIDLRLLDLIPDDDPVYAEQFRTCLREGMHPAVASIQAVYDLNVYRGNRRDRTDDGRWTTHRGRRMSDDTKWTAAKIPAKRAVS